MDGGGAAEHLIVVTMSCFTDLVACFADLRHFARAVKLRIRATNNVAKITNVMKLVASSKLKSVEDALSKGRVFGQSLLNAVAIKEEVSLSRCRRRVTMEDSCRRSVESSASLRGMLGAAVRAVTQRTGRAQSAAPAAASCCSSLAGSSPAHALHAVQ